MSRLCRTRQRLCGCGSMSSSWKSRAGFLQRRPCTGAPNGPRATTRTCKCTASSQPHPGCAWLLQALQCHRSMSMPIMQWRILLAWHSGRAPVSASCVAASPEVVAWLEYYLCLSRGSEVVSDQVHVYQAASCLAADASVTGDKISWGQQFHMLAEGS